MEQKHPHRVAIEYLAKLTAGKAEEFDEIRLRAAEAILRTDYYAFLIDEPIEPVVWTCTGNTDKTATFDSSPDSGEMPKLEFTTGPLGEPLTISVSIPGKPEEFPGVFIRFPALPEGADSWLVYAPGKLHPVYRVLPDGSVIKPTKPYDIVEEAPTPMSGAMREAVEITNDVVLGKPEQPWADRIVDKLNEISYMNFFNWAWVAPYKTFASDRGLSGVVYISADTACKAVGEEFPKPKMKTTYKRYSGAESIPSPEKVVVTHPAKSEVVNDYMKTGHTKYPSPGAVEAVKILDDARYNGFRWGFAWNPDDALETRNHHPNPKICHCITPYTPDDTAFYSKVSEDEAIYLAEKIKKQETNRQMFEDGAPKKPFDESMPDKIVDSQAQSNREWATKMVNEIHEMGKKPFVAPVLTGYGDRSPVTGIFADGSPKRWKSDEICEIFGSMGGTEQLRTMERLSKLQRKPEPMTVERAVEVLNLREHRGFNRWAVNPGRRSAYIEGNGSDFSLLAEEAIAIAEKLERE